MSFIWPLALLALAFVPLLVIAYVRLMERRAASAAELGTMRLAHGASGRRVGLRRHIPPVVFLMAITLLLVAVSRPQVAVALPHEEGTVILAFDVSSSMMADDLEPSRLGAAKEAARAFVEDQPSTVRIGVVAFSFGGLVVQQPTEVQADVIAAIDRLSAQGGTSLGEGMFASLRAVSDKPIVLDEAAAEGDLGGVEIGYFPATAIVLLSDGENTANFDPLAIAELAASAGVRVYPIGIGSPDGTTVEIEGFRVATSLNEPLLEQIASITGGTYFHAADEVELVDVYDSLDLQLTISGEEMEITSLLAAAALVLVIVGAVLTMIWFGRMP